MPDFLKYIHELSVNGKPVEEDELEDDYTSEPDDDENDEGNDDTTNINLSPSNNTEEGDDNNDTDTDDNNDDDSDDYTVGAEDTNQEESDPGDENNDDTGADPDNTDGDTDSGEPSDSDDNNSNELDMGGDDDEDYTDSGEEETGEESSDNNGDIDNGDDSSDDVSDTDSLEDKIKKTEAEIFNTLSEDEKVIKNKELIDNYIEAKKTIKLFTEKVRTITVTDNNREILYFVEDSLISLDNIIRDYIISRYNKKSYIENFITYNHFILTITQLVEIVNKLKNIENEPQK